MGHVSRMVNSECVDLTWNNPFTQYSMNQESQSFILEVKEYRALMQDMHNQSRATYTHILFSGTVIVAFARMFLQMIH